MLQQLARWRSLKDRIIRHPSFHRAMMRMPFTRPLANRYAQSLFDICAGFVYSQVLSAAVHLNLFERLAVQPMTAAQLAPAVSLPVESVQALLGACVSLRLLEHRPGGAFGIATLGAAILANPIVPAMVRHHALLYADLADPVGLLKNGHQGTRQAEFWAYATSASPSDLQASQVEDYSRLMAQSQESIAGEILDAYPLSRHRCLLDVGAGEGVFMANALARTPGLSGIAFDLPAVTGRAQEKLVGAGFAARVRMEGGDFFSDDLPLGADIVSLVRVAFDHDDARVMALLKSVRKALPPGGTILIAEPMAENAARNRVQSAYFAFYLMAMGHGKPRTPQHFFAMLNEAGFSSCRSIRVNNALMTSLVLATANPSQAKV